MGRWVASCAPSPREWSATGWGGLPSRAPCPHVRRGAAKGKGVSCPSSTPLPREWEGAAQSKGEGEGLVATGCPRAPSRTYGVAQPRGKGGAGGGMPSCTPLPREWEGWGQGEREKAVTVVPNPSLYQLQLPKMAADLQPVATDSHGTGPGNRLTLTCTHVKPIPVLTGMGTDKSHRFPIPLLLYTTTVCHVITIVATAAFAAAIFVAVVVAAVIAVVIAVVTAVITVVTAALSWVGGPALAGPWWQSVAPAAWGCVREADQVVVVVDSTIIKIDFANEPIKIIKIDFTNELIKLPTGTPTTPPLAPQVRCNAMTAVGGNQMAGFILARSHYEFAIIPLHMAAAGCIRVACTGALVATSPNQLRPTATRLGYNWLRRLEDSEATGENRLATVPVAVAQFRPEDQPVSVQLLPNWEKNQTQLDFQTLVTGALMHIPSVLMGRRGGCKCGIGGRGGEGLTRLRHPLCANGKEEARERRMGWVPSCASILQSGRCGQGKREGAEEMGKGRWSVQVGEEEEGNSPLCTPFVHSSRTAVNAEEGGGDLPRLGWGRGPSSFANGEGGGDGRATGMGGGDTLHLGNPPNSVMPYQQHTMPAATQPPGPSSAPHLCRRVAYEGTPLHVAPAPSRSLFMPPRSHEKGARDPSLLHRAQKGGTQGEHSTPLPVTTGPSPSPLTAPPCTRACHPWPSPLAVAPRTCVEGREGHAAPSPLGLNTSAGTYKYLWVCITLMMQNTHEQGCRSLKGALVFSPTLPVIPSLSPSLFGCAAMYAQEWGMRGYATPSLTLPIRTEGGCMRACHPRHLPSPFATPPRTRRKGHEGHPVATSPSPSPFDRTALYAQERGTQGYATPGPPFLFARKGVTRVHRPWHLRSTTPPCTHRKEARKGTRHATPPFPFAQKGRREGAQHPLPLGHADRGHARASHPIHAGKGRTRPPTSLHVAQQDRCHLRVPAF
ncbi:hypothetical protein EDB85DRAFT_1891792 [Lactarius pseudohatsudake]|nr:hypothetical protein EDB85DRAFT_1891792 [Lactarius pseudohatsudake]